MPIPKKLREIEVKKDKGQILPIIKSKLPGNVAYRINGKACYAPRGDRIVHNIERIDPTLASKLIVTTMTLLDETIKLLTPRDKTVSYSV